MRWVEKRIWLWRAGCEATSHGKLADQQPNTPPTHCPPGARKSKDELANGRTREKMACAQAQALLEMA